MSDSPQASETFVRQWYPEDESLEAHHKAITAQARAQERSLLLDRTTHKRINDLTVEVKASFARVEASQADLVLKLTKKEQSSALLTTLIDASKALLVALVTLAGAYMMRPEAPPPQAPRLDPQTLEAIRLYEQRNGYRLGQRPPGGGEPEPFDAGK